MAAYSLPDLHGSLGAAELTSGTTLADAFRYDGYGQTIASGGSHTGPAQPYRYQGRLDISPDATQPVYDLGARFYQPAIGVFTQLDSVAGSAQDTLSLNRYLYAEANPATLIDPDGHMAISGTDVSTSYRAYVTVTPSGKRILHTIAPPRRVVRTKPPAIGRGFLMVGANSSPKGVISSTTARNIQELRAIGKSHEMDVIEQLRQKYPASEGYRVVHDNAFRDPANPLRALRDNGVAYRPDVQVWKGTDLVEWGDAVVVGSQSTLSTKVAKVNGPYLRLALRADPQAPLGEVYDRPMEIPGMLRGAEIVDNAAGPVFLLPLFIDLLRGHDPWQDVYNEGRQLAPELFPEVCPCTG